MRRGYTAAQRSDCTVSNVGWTGRKGNWDTIMRVSFYMGNVPLWIWQHWYRSMWRMEAGICEHGCENLSHGTWPTFRIKQLLQHHVTWLMNAVFSAQTRNLCRITRRHAPVTRAKTLQNRRLPQETVNILSSWTTISVWGTAVCPQDITAVTKRCATSFSSGILSGAPVMSLAHNNAPARLQVFKWSILRALKWSYGTEGGSEELWPARGSNSLPPCNFLNQYLSLQHFYTSSL